jgi:hypothetical protein
MDGLTVYGRNRNGAGGRNVSISIDGLTVLIQSNDEETNARAVAVARTLIDHGEVLAALERCRGEVTALKQNLVEQRAAAAAARANLLAAAEGRRRFFGPVLCVPAQGGDWSGAVWLLDPEKGERGRGLRFASLAELRARHPELWIIAVTDRGVLLDAATLKSEEVP